MNDADKNYNKFLNQMKNNAKAMQGLKTESGFSVDKFIILLINQVPFMALGVIHSIYGKHILSLEGFISLTCFILILAPILRK